MGNAASGKESSADKPASFSERFGLRKTGALLIFIVILLVGVWVWIRGTLPYEGMLGRPLRVGIVQWPGYACGLVANKGLRPNKDSFFWKRELLVEFVIIEDEEQLRRDFIRGGDNGGVDVMWSTVDSLAQQAPAFLKAGVRPRAFMQVDWSHGGDAIIASSGINQIEDLKGKRIAVSMSASQWLLEYSLEHSSLSEQEKQQIRQNRIITKKGSQEAGDMFANKMVDAAVLWEPNVTDALKRRGPGSKILIDTEKASNLIADVMVAKEEFIQRYPRVIAAFIEGWLIDGTTEAIKDPMLAVKVLLEEPLFEDLGEQKTQEMLGKAVWATLDDNVQMFGLSGDNKVFFDELFNNASNIWLKNQYITETVKAEQVRNIERLKEINEARPARPKLGCSMETPVETIKLAVPFPARKAELSDEARSILNNQEALFLLQTHPGIRFCVQADPVEGDDLQRAREISTARENAVIEYLVKNYRRPWSQFVSASDPNPEASGAGVGTQYIKLKLIDARRPPVN
ncbi:MAG: ABC transporter substrate-binding protein [Pyrinomonadaceae bacterium]|nr:ABC transporter substrate-binding protein [Pyrinomonadaceae bacterium]